MFDDHHGSGIRFYFGACCGRFKTFSGPFFLCAVFLSPCPEALFPDALFCVPQLSADIFLSVYPSVSPCLSLSPSHLSHVFT